MKKTVYRIGKKLKAIDALLEERGFEVVGSDGAYDDELLSSCWALMPGRAYVTDEILSKAPNLKVVCKQGAGVDRIDVAACTRRGIYVVNTPGTNSLSVAEHAFALMIAAAKQLWPISQSVRSINPDPYCASKYQSVELGGKTLSIIGFGNIGSIVANMAAAFGMHVIVYSRHASRSDIPAHMELVSSLEDALRRADFVSLHVAGSEQNRRLIGAPELAKMKPGAYIINTTRGFVVDEAALYEALKEKRIAGAGLDVVCDEPLRPDNPLLTLDNVMITPHTGSNTNESWLRSLESCAALIESYANGQIPIETLNPEAGQNIKHK